MPLSISGGEFEAPRSMPSALHFVLQFVEQPAGFGRVLFGASKFDQPILRGGCLPEFGKGRRPQAGRRTDTLLSGFHGIEHWHPRCAWIAIVPNRLSSV